MSAELTNHLWQSTVLALLAGLLSVAFRRNHAQVRYWLWFGASVKFLAPFAPLLSLGGYLHWDRAGGRIAAAPSVSFAMVWMAQPFAGAAPTAAPVSAAVNDWIPLAIFAVWLAGFVAVLLTRVRGWLAIRAAVRSAVPLDVPAAIEVRSAPGLLEPGIAGLFHPILLLPSGIAGRLEPRQFEAVIAHELCHARRRDNLTSAVHMMVEAIFWFHPLVWWIGARMIEERERACDEAVLRAGHQPGDYVQGILNVCRYCLESPLACLPGVTGADIQKRVETILSGRATRDLNRTGKLALSAAGVAAIVIPILAGVAGAPRIQAQSPPEARSATVPKFEAASIRPCPAFRNRSIQDLLAPDRLRSGCTSISRLIQQAYGLYANGHMNPLASVGVVGGPAWVRSDFYEIDAKAPGSQSHAVMNGPMLQAFLEDRLKLKIRRETREIPVYKLTVTQGGARLEQFHGNCIPWDFDNPPAHPPDPSSRCGTSRLTGDGFDMHAASMTDLGMFFAVTMDRPVLNETGITGRFNLHMAVPAESFRKPRGLPALSGPAEPASSPALISAIQGAVVKLGLNLEPASAPGEFLVIESIRRPGRS
jgi:uncharacterized protein (TIGR03435 family)